MLRRWLLVPLAVAIGGAVLAACFPPGPPPPPPEITYQLTGTCTIPNLLPNAGSPCSSGGTAVICPANDVFATFFNGSGDIEQHCGNSTYTVTITRPPDGFVDISGQLQGDGTVTCTISRGGQVLASNTASGAYEIADCSAEV